MPGAAGEVGGLGVDEVLAVVEIEDGEAAGGLGGVLGREIDEDGAVVGEDGGVEVEELVAGDGRGGQGLKRGLARGAGLAGRESGVGCRTGYGTGLRVR